MSDGVARLKALLLDRERRELGELAGKIDQLFDRAGSRERLQTSVAEVLDGAIRDAHGRQPKDLAASVAPLVVDTVRTEIAHSGDMLAETLNPHIGRMVASYVSNAIKDMMARLNQRLESGLSVRRWAIKLKSIATGTPESELLLADVNRLEVEEIYLIRRGSGELVHHWVAEVGSPAGAASGQSSNRDAIVSGFLTAINEFAAEAFAADQSSLQTLDLQRHRVYLRTSPAYLLAARCSGVPTGDMEQGLDAEFLSFLERHRVALAGRMAPGRSSELQEALDGLADGIAQRLSALPQIAPPAAGPNLAKWLLITIACGVVGWLLWGRYVDWRTESTRIAAQAALDASALRNYPVAIEVEHGGREVRLKGLAPSGADKDALLAAMGSLGRRATVVDRIDVLPAGESLGPELQGLRRDVQANLERSAATANLLAARRALEHATARLGSMDQQLAALEHDASATGLQELVARLRSRLAGAVGEIGKVLDTTSRDSANPSLVDADRAITGVGGLLEESAATLGRLRGEQAARQLAARAQMEDAAAPRHLAFRRRAEHLAVSADALGDEVAVSQQHVLRHTISDLRARLEALSRVPGTSARQEVET